MAQINIITTVEERDLVCSAIERLGDEATAISKIAKEADLMISRARYAVSDLVEAGVVSREPVKVLNEHFKRFIYKVVE